MAEVDDVGRFAEAGRKRPRDLDASAADDGGSVRGYPEAAALSLPPPPPPPARIKLSLKLGALRRQAAVAAADAGASDEHIDIDGGVDGADPAAGLPATAPVAAGNGVARGPRIKLRLSFKGAAADGAHLPRRSWDGVDSSPAAPAALSPGSAVPHSPPDSVASGMSSAHRRRSTDAMLPPRLARITYSPSRESDADSDASIDASYNASDIEGHSYEHTPQTPLGAEPRRRGRPPLRGRPGLGAAHRQGGPPRQLSGTFTTTVSLESSLRRLVKRIRKRDSYGFFLEPVDTRMVPDYRDVIDNPMDLGTMQRKVDARAYRGIGEFRSDLLLVCSNARKYNGAGSIYAKSADRMQEYALLAIDRETVKLERVGKASLPTHAAAQERRDLYGSRSRSRTGSMSPARHSALDDHSDSHPGSAYAADASLEHRRSSRLRWRGASESQEGASKTPAEIVDNFKWLSGPKKKYKRASTVPRRIVESQAKIALLADGSIDTTGFEEDVAHIPFDRDHSALPLLCRARPAAQSSAQSLYAHGRYYAPPTHASFGPCRPPATAAAGMVGPDHLSRGLSAICGDSLGLAYWHSVGEFISGAGDAGGEVEQYAATVMDHLSGGAHGVMRNALGFLRSRADCDKSAAPECKSGLGSVDLPELVTWLDSRHERDLLFSQRTEALTQPIVLRDISARCAAKSEAGRPAHLTDAQKRALFASNSRSLENLHALQTAGAELPQGDIEALETNIYALAQLACLKLAGSAHPSTLVPRLAPPPAPASVSAATLPSASPQTARQMPGAHVQSRESRFLAPRPARAVSTPSLPTLHSASLASAVRSDLMGDLARDSDTDLGYPF